MLGPMTSPKEGYAADWTVAQLRDAAQKIADHIEALMRGSKYRRSCREYEDRNA